MAEAKSVIRGSRSGRHSHGGGSRKRGRSEKDRAPRKKNRKPVLSAYEVFYGGDISDPLGLNCDTFGDVDSQSGDDHLRHPEPVEDSLQTSELSRTDEDPLNVLADARKEAQKERKRRQRKRVALRREEKRKQSTGDEEERSERTEKSVARRRSRRRSFSKDGESTAEEEPGNVAKRKKRRRRLSPSKDSAASDMKQHVFRPQDAKFAMGNYDRYYGYRNPSGGSDQRLKCLPKSLFSDKACLDIGCNVGHLTLSIARDFAPQRVIGVDIDAGLVEVAERNVRHYVVSAVETEKPVPVKREFPMSFKLVYGPIASMCLRPPVQPVAGKGFPLNVSFKQENYVANGLELACSQKPEFDAILALSITKWIHLNWGDDGVKTLFHRVYHHLSPGGSFVLEPQPWQSYARKSKLTPTTLDHYRSIDLQPEQFEDYLLNQVGFSSVESLPTPKHEAKGFQRPMLLFTKSEKSDAYCNLCRPKRSESDGKKKKKRVCVSTEEMDTVSLGNEGQNSPEVPMSETS